MMTKNFENYNIGWNKLCPSYQVIANKFSISVCDNKFGAMELNTCESINNRKNKVTEIRANDKIKDVEIKPCGL